MPTNNGTRGLFLQPARYERNESGTFVILEWHGDRVSVKSQIPGVEGMGGLWEVQESFTGGADKLIARFSAIPGAAQEVINTWELFGQDTEKDLLEADNTAVNAISDDDKRKIRDAISSPTPGKSPALTDANAINIYLLMLNGLRSLRVPVPTLRHTQTVSNNYTVPLAFMNIKRIISTTSMVSLESIPLNTMLSLPIEVSNRTGLTYGWYKKYPTLRQAAWQKSQIEQEWEYGLWPPLVLGAVI
jgi:hypothetical protein